MSATKTCRQCRNDLVQDSFRRHRGCQGGLWPVCRRCEDLEKKEFATIRDPSAFKRCCKCRLILSRNDFHSDGKANSNSRCKKCQSTYNAQVGLRLHATSALAKEGQACADCGERNPNVLEFDHVRGIKERDVSGMRGRPTTAIRAEIDKCDIVCRCCHRVRSLTTKWKPAISEKRANAHIKYRNHAFVTSEKLKRGHCDACSRPVKSANHAETCQFDFDHIDRKTKAFNISKAVKCGYSLERITGELRKCRLLCANCHLIHTRQQLGFRTYREPQPR
ncbi:hypothetical protein [Medusavirus stheno T3]|uniref:HNH endonuclease n=1 Tax=Medusavirus stheno T3 TaxID=3069717 RepID=A0A7S8BDF0_9VIRU|nr:hypothetical protein QKU73_gp369 [Acanthamoeba castellanii medusavirus]QPB44406.1 hypothetical protein [Medusavirus stheno T3]